MGWEIRKLSGHCGARLTGASLSDLSDADFETLRDALFAHGVVTMPDQDLSPDAHLALAERFGSIEVNRFFTPVPGHPRIAEVRTRPEDTLVIGGRWHTDHSYDPAPAMCSILVARELPPFGGDTQFASMTAACAALSPGFRAMLERLDAVHSDATFRDSKLDMNQDDAAYRGAVRHPVLIRHPVTGAQAVYVNGDFTVGIDGWSEEESAVLLAYLYAFVTRPQFTTRVVWAPGTVTIWDNRLVQHFATADYQGHARLMHRVTVAGEPLAR